MGGLFSPQAWAMVWAYRATFLHGLGNTVQLAAVGLVLSLATSLSMLPLFGKMDRRGRVMNAAFSVSGAFALGGQMAFIASVEPGPVVAAFVCAKLAGGVCALLAGRLFCPAEQ